MSFFFIGPEHKGRRRAGSIVLLVLVLGITVPFGNYPRERELLVSGVAAATAAPTTLEAWKDGQTLIIDRLEGQRVICETALGAMVELAVGRIPSGCREGTVLVVSGGRLIRQEVAKGHAQLRIEQLSNELWKR